ncbi:glycosyltransferase family 4 protein [Hufsiella ginkgonis]|uniref:Glycosyltransferase n=1 Tax=Hufsiella ginkgonis TaxID=2695274 RepID=A0A7K1Y098_9SPHI|nr:glycosyltransferase family 4 protein [Hufsiella ginkgonis]MXV16701.1 glycosyltransferase [Hufsiella ginkgonis]
MTTPYPVNEKPRILYVFGGEKAQGAEIVIERLMDENAENADTHLFISPGTFAANLVNSGKPYHITLVNSLKKLNRPGTSKIQFYAKAIGNYFRISLQAFRYIRKNGIQQVHANTLVPASYLAPAVIYCRLFLPRISWYWSDHDLGYHSSVDRALSQVCARLYDRTLVVSAAVKRKYTANDKVQILYNGLDPEMFKCDEAARVAFRNTLGVDDGKVLIGIAASINPDKGQLALIRAFNRLDPALPASALLIAGDYAVATPSYSSEVKQAINRTDGVRHLGFSDDIVGFYNGCDIIINNSNRERSESLGTSIYEAMACEKIVIAANTGGNPEIITDKLDGFLFETESEDDLLEKLSFCIANHVQLSPVKVAARRKVLEKFNVHEMADKYRELSRALNAERQRKTA